MNEGEQKHSLKLQVNEPPQNFDDNSMVFFSENDANKIGIFAGDIVLIKVFPWSILISVAFLACCTIFFLQGKRGKTTFAIYGSIETPDGSICMNKVF